MADQNFRVKRGLEVGIGGTVLTATANGNIGIGTTNPSTTLDVNGGFRLRGALYDKDNQAGSANQVLISTGSGIDWVNAAPTNAITGLTVRDEGNLVGTASSVSELNFVGNIVSVASTAGIATVTFGNYIASAGIATYATSAGIATNIKGGLAGNIPYQSAADTTVFLANGSSGTILQSNGVGNAPSWVTAAPAGAITGLTIRDEGSIVGTANSVTSINFVGPNITATASGAGATITVADYVSVSGVATYATTAGVATALQNARTISLTGDISGSTTFDGTANVSIAATIQPNSVALGGDTTGDYVQSISGTSNQITVTSGTGEGSTPTLSLPNNLVLPQDVTVTRDLQVNRNLNVTGNITLGGTTAFINVQELKISDPDIVLGVRTDAFGNDVSNDNTANHGGVALASTEGTPLVQLFIAGIETNPATYKKIMWFKAGTFSGLGTDAWLMNYAVGIGSTQFPTGTRLAAGAVQFTENDLAVVRNINASGVVTATSFSGNASSATYATSAGIATYATSAGIATYATSSGIATYATTAGVSTSVIGGISSVTQLSVSGISSLNVGIFSGNTTTDLVRITQIGTGNALVVEDSTNPDTTPFVIDSSGNTGIGTITPAAILDIRGNPWFSPNVTGAKATALRLGRFVDGVNPAYDILTDDAGGDILEFRSNRFNGNLLISRASPIGIHTVFQFDSNYISGNTISIGNTLGVNSQVKIQLNDSGNTFFLNDGAILVGTSSSTGTASQKLQVNGGAYVSGNLGVGVTNPASNTQVAIAGTLGISEVGVNGTRTLFTSSGSGFVLNHNDNSNITIQSQGSNKLQYQYSPNFWSIPSGIPFLVGTGTSTGTASQLLQVTGGAYVSGSVGIGTTNPQSTRLDVHGPVAFGTGTDYDSTFSSVLIRQRPAADGYASLSFYPANGNLVAKIDAINASNELVVWSNKNSTVGNRININMGTSEYISFSPRASEAMRIIQGGTVLIGAATSTGTTAQRLQVTGGAYISTSTGIGTTNPLQTLHVLGNVLVAAGTSTGQHITQKAYELNSGTLSWEGSAGQLFSITNNLTSGSIFSVNDVSGIPSIDVNADGTIQLAPYGTNERVGVGTTAPTSKLHVIGDVRVSGVITASSFSGNASSATYATSAGVSTNLKGGLAGNIPYQSAADTTVFLANGSSGTILQSNGVGNAPSWVTAAPAGAITGLTIRDEGSIVGTANSVSQFDFRGINIIATASGGISTITVADNLVGTGLSISGGISTLGVTTFTGAVSFGTSAYFGDNDVLNFGDGNDLRIYHDGSNSFIQDLGTGGLYLAGSSLIALQSAAGETKLVARTDGAVELYYDNVKEFETTGYGATVFGVLQSQGIQVAGVVTATTFIGALTGTASSATQLVTPRTISISGDVVGSTTFDGTANVSIAATIQPNSVALGGDTTGDYVANITGTSNQITVTSGTGEGSTPTLSIPSQFTAPQDVTVTRDLQVNRNLNVTGNITIGGTSATIFSQTLNIYDPDIVLGVRTDGSGNDVSNDNTANHGGIAIASTEGSPLVNLFIAGIETNPATYKKIMWFKAGTFSGLGTDAWLSNYAVGIGSTQFPTGTRLAAGSVQFTENDLAVVRNINASGITTSSRLTLNGANSTSDGGGQIFLNGATGNRIDFNTNGVAAPSFTTRSAGTKLVLYPTVSGSQVDYGLGIEGFTLWYSIAQNLNTFQHRWYAGTTQLADLKGSGELVIGSTSLTGTASQRLQVTGGAYVSGSVGIGTTNPGGKLDVRGGDIILNTANNPATEYGRIRTLDNLHSIILRGISNDVNGTPSATNAISFVEFGGIWRYYRTDGTQNKIVAEINDNISYFNNSGPLTIGTATSTGTASQKLQVTGGGYFSSSVGIGTTNPGSTLDVRATGATIRVQNPASSNYSVLLDANTGGPRISLGQNGDNVFVDFGAYSGTNNWDTKNRDLKIFSTAATNAFVLKQATGNILINSTSETGTASQALQVNSGAYVSGNLGIGNTNPGARLDVAGDIRLSGADPEIELNTGGPRLKVPASNTLTIHTGGGLNTTTNELVRINTTGVGIVTTNPVATFQVKDALAFETTNTTTTNTNQVAVDTFATATFRSAKYQAQITCPGQISTLGGITTGGRGYTAGTFNVTFTTSSGNGSAAQGTLTISNGTVGQISVGTTGGSGYATGDVLTASGGSGLQVSVASTASPTGRITGLTLSSAGIGYTGYYNATTGTGTTSLTFLGGTGTGAVGLATIFDGVITSSVLLQQPTTGTGGTTYYSGSNYSTASVLSVTRSDLTNTITTITGSVGVSTFTSLTAHGIGVSDVVRVSSTSNGLTAGTDYYVVTTPTTTTFTLGSAVGVGTTFTTGSSLSIGFFRNSSRDGGQVAYTNAITGVSTNHQVSDLMVLHNGTTADFVEYATIANNDILGTFAADISGANARLLFTPTYPNNNIKVARQAITV